jgi:molybdate transport system substrate-binding protein
VRSAAVVCLAALSLDASAAEEPGLLRVGAAASLREVALACARAFEAEQAGVTVAVSFGATSVLAAQLRAGAPLDVLLSADAEQSDALARDGIVHAPVVLARNRLVVIARPELAPFAAAADLAGPAIRRVAVPHAAVPVGRYARQWLAGRGLLEALRGRLVATEHARATLVAVEQGAADAAIVYVTDAALARRARVAWEIPASEQPEIVYAASVTRGARDPERARAFVALLTGEIGRGVFARAGFAPGAAP